MSHSYLRNRLPRMKIAVDAFLSEESVDKDVKGIFVFGSYPKGIVRPSSDIDLIVLHRSKRDHTTFISQNEIFECIYLTPEDMIRLVSRGMWIDIVLTGEILYDPDDAVKELKDKVAKWEWTPEHIGKQIELSKEEIEKSIKMLNEQRPWDALQFTRNAATELMRATLMKNQQKEISLVHLGDLLDYIREKDKRLYQIVASLHDFTGVSPLGLKEWISKIQVRRNEVEQKAIIQLLNELDDQGPSELLGKYKSTIKKLRPSKTQIRNAEDCLEKGNHEGALLHMRWSLRLLGMLSSYDTSGGLLKHIEIHDPNYYQLMIEIGGFRNITADNVKSWNQELTQLITSNFSEFVDVNNPST